MEAFLLEAIFLEAFLLEAFFLEAFFLVGLFLDTPVQVLLQQVFNDLRTPPPASA